MCTLFISMLFLSTFVLADYEITNCGETITEDSVLTSDLECSSQAGVNIGADNVRLDCNGYTLSLLIGSNPGVYVNGYDNALITNCVIEDFSTGIQLSDSTGSQVSTDNFLINNGRGIRLWNSHSTTLEGNEITGSDKGILVESGSTDVVIENNYIGGSGNFGIELLTVSPVQIVGNTFENILQYGIYASSLTDFVIQSNDFQTMRNDAMFLNTINSGEISDNTFNNVGGNAVDLYNAFDVDVFDNDVAIVTDRAFIGDLLYDVEYYLNGISNSQYAFDFTNSDLVLIRENNVDTVSFGFHGDQIDNLDIYENSFQNVDDSSLKVLRSNVVTIRDNLMNETQHGVELSGGDVIYVEDNIFYGKNDPIIGGVGISLTDYFILAENIHVEENRFSGFSTNLYYNNVGENNDFVSNYFCDASDFDISCDDIHSDLYSGNGNFFDTVNYCEVPPVQPLGCNIQLNIPSSTYTLTNNMYCGFVDAFEVIANDVTIDCDGWTISGLQSANNAIYNRADGLTVQNCNIKGFDYGIYAETLPGSPKHFTVENTQIQDVGVNGIFSNYMTVDINGSYFLNNLGADIELNGASSASNIESTVMCGTNTNLLCNAAAQIHSVGGNYINAWNSVCGVADPSTVEDCSHAPGPILDARIVETFPTDFTNSYSCVESNACGDGQDNDLNGFVDCADSQCDLKPCVEGDNTFACIEGACVQVLLPEAELATVEAEQVHVGYLWSYGDVFSWLNSATVYHEFGTCLDICASYGQACLFADAGRSLCSSPSSEKCTCI